jgi:hypothetical protein
MKQMVKPSKYKAGVGKKTRGTVVSYIWGIGWEFESWTSHPALILADCVNNNTDWFRGLHFKCGRTTELQRLKSTQRNHRSEEYVFKVDDDTGTGPREGENSIRDDHGTKSNLKSKITSEQHLSKTTNLFIPLSL